MAPDVLDRLRAADPAARMPEPDPDDRERLRRAIVATPPAPRAGLKRRRLGGRTLVVLLGGAVLLAGGTVYAARLVVGGQSETANLASVPFGAPDRIVFTQVTGYPFDIVIVDSKGKKLRRLARWSHQPAFSPDGSRIAYIHLGHLWVMNADGSDKRELLDRPAAMPAWSPDGEQIVFVYGPGGFPNGGEEGPLLVVNADGSGLRQVSKDKGVSGKDPAWALDGRIFFDTTTSGEIPGLGQVLPGTAEICSVDADGSDLRSVTAAPSPTSFSLSPDGKWLLVWDSSADRLVRLLSNGQGMAVVVVDSLSRLFWRYPHSKATEVESSWSPDGTKIAFACVSTAHHPGGGWDWSGLYIVKADGSGLRKVPDSGKRSLPSAFKGPSIAIDPVWQPR